MNTYFVIAGITTILLGLIHSVLGEVLIFSKLRGRKITAGEFTLKDRHLRTLWATWHLVSLLGWGIAAILLSLSWPISSDEALSVIKVILPAMFLITSVFWVFATRGKHPAWVVLLIIASLVWFA